MKGLHNLPMCTVIWIYLLLQVMTCAVISHVNKRNCSNKRVKRYRLDIVKKKHFINGVIPITLFFTMIVFMLCQDFFLINKIPRSLMVLKHQKKA